MKLIISTAICFSCLMSIVGAQTATQEPQRRNGVIDIDLDRQVNLRAAPSASSESLLKLDSRQVVLIRGNSVFNGETEWVPVQVGDSQGWITKKFLRVTSPQTPAHRSADEQIQTQVAPGEQESLTPSSSSTEKPQDLPKRYRVTGVGEGDFLYVRSGPGTNYRPVTKMDNGIGGIQILDGTMVNGDDDWVHIISQDLEGWARPKYFIAEEISTSDKINFQRAVTGNNMPMATRYIRPESVDEPYVQYPQNPDDVGHPHPPVAYAALYGHTKLLILLAEHGADIKCRVGGYSLAFHAAKRGHFQTAETALKYGGGTEEDIANGKVSYNLSKINPTAVGLGVALVVTAAALQALSDGSSSSASGGDLYHDRNGRLLSPVEVSGRITDDIAGLGDPYR